MDDVAVLNYMRADAELSPQLRELYLKSESVSAAGQLYPGKSQ